MSLHHPAQLELFLFDNGMPEGGTSLATQTPWGKTLQTTSVIDKDGAEQQLTIAHPIALLWVAASKCSSFSKFFLEKLKETPPSIDKPWRLVAYTDEVLQETPWHRRTTESSKHSIGHF